jgi:hypothetical protein
MREILTGLAFKDLGVCGMCGGQVHKWQRGNVLVYVRKKTNIFRVRERNHYVTQWLPISQLNETIKTYFPTTTENN